MNADSVASVLVKEEICGDTKESVRGRSLINANRARGISLMDSTSIYPRMPTVALMQSIKVLKVIKMIIHPGHHPTCENSSKATLNVGFAWRS